MSCDWRKLTFKNEFVSNYCKTKNIDFNYAAKIASTLLFLKYFKCDTRMHVLLQIPYRYL